MVVAATLCLPWVASAQKYANGLIDKTVAVIGNEAITVSQIEEQVQMMRAQGMSSDRNMRCELLEHVDIPDGVLSVGNINRRPYQGLRESPSPLCKCE